jgi:hypothetical protein
MNSKNTVHPQFFSDWYNTFRGYLSKMEVRGAFECLESKSLPPEDIKVLEAYLERNKLDIGPELQLFYTQAASQVIECWRPCNAPYLGPKKKHADFVTEAYLAFVIPHYKQLKRWRTEVIRSTLAGFIKMDKTERLQTLVSRGFVISDRKAGDLLFLLPENDFMEPGVYFFSWEMPFKRNVIKCADSLAEWMEFAASAGYPAIVFKNIKKWHDGERCKVLTHESK